MNLFSGWFGRIKKKIKACPCRTCSFCYTCENREKSPSSVEGGVHPCNGCSFCKLCDKLHRGIHVRSLNED